MTPGKMQKRRPGAVWAEIFDRGFNARIEKIQFLSGNRLFSSCEHSEGHKSQTKNISQIFFHGIAQPAYGFQETELGRLRDFQCRTQRSQSWLKQQILH